MNRKVILRGASIVVLAIAASTYGTHLLLSERSEVMHVSDARDQPLQTKSDTFAVKDTQMTALLVADADLMARTRTNGADTAHANRSEAAPGCEPTLTAKAAVDALIELVLTAPCHPDTRLVISHADLAFTEQTDQDGNFATFLPALAADARVDVFLGDDIYQQASVTVPDIDAYFRLVAQWTGTPGLGLHGFHLGAEFGGEGHLHARKPFDQVAEDAFLITLGNRDSAEPMIAEIYSIPIDLASSSRAELVLDFDDSLCGQVVSAYVFSSTSGTPSDVNDTQMMVPECPSETGTLIMDLPLSAQQPADFASH